MNNPLDPVQPEEERVQLRPDHEPPLPTPMERAFGIAEVPSERRHVVQSLWQDCAVAMDMERLRAASDLNDRGRACADAGDLDGALSWYQQSLDTAPEYEPAWFNAGLVHKQRRDWEQAMRCNQRAAELSTGEPDEPAWWNLGIAATALRRWEIARESWRRYGITIPDGDGELALDFGSAPVRLDPEGAGEVVWGRRIDPARVVVLNVPTPPSGHRWGDIVLHDGAPNGERRLGDQVYAVFDELERWQPSEIPTLEVQVTVEDAAGGDALAEIFDAAGFAAQDWTGTVRILCRRCSQGQPHAHPPNEVGPERTFGLAAPLGEAVGLLREWAVSGSGTRAYSEPVAVG
jgi:tetratricopeptide (TPR) repeat protein